MSLLKEAIQKIQEAGESNVRIISLDAKKSKIEVRGSEGWKTIIPEIDTILAEDVLRQAKSRLIIG